jgi:putative transposase
MLLGTAAATPSSNDVMNTSGHPGRPPRLQGIFPNYESPLFFVTFNVVHRRPILATPQVHAVFCAYAKRGFEMRAAVVGRYVIMPDHVHLFVHVVNVKLGKWIKGLKRSMSSAILIDKTESHWQPGFFDHLLRNDECYEQKWNYVWMNPVRAGLVVNPEDWPYQGEIVKIDRL